MNMTNLQSIGGGITWMAAAALLLLATFEPVKIGDTQPATQTAAAMTSTAKAA
jgi:hypothetical protein